jgi:hypothetical protein
MVVIDVAPRPNPFAATLATEAAARYLPLPGLDGARVGLEVSRLAGAAS